MRKLRPAVLAIALILSVTHSAFATTWAPAEIVCPVCKHKNTFMQVMSFGNYIYHWPSKFQYIYWPLTDSNVLYSCLNCHYTAFMFDFNDTKPDKLAQIKQMLARLSFEGKYEKYTDIPMSQRLAIAEKVYQIIGEDDDFWCRFERVRGYHFAAEKKETEAAEARRKALSLAEKMLQSKPKSPSEKELSLITGGMKYFLKDHEGAIKDFEHGLTLKFSPPDLEKEKAEGFDAYLSDVLKQFIAAIRDEEKAKTEPVWPHKILKGHEGWVMAAAYSPDGSLVASADIDDGLLLWDGRTGTLKNTFPKRNVIQTITFSPDSKLLLAGGYNKTIDIWDLQSNTLLKSLTGHVEYVHDLVFSPDGKVLASGSWDDTIKLWDVTTWTPIRTFKNEKSVWHMSFSSDGAILASIDSDGAIRLWETKTGKLRRRFSFEDKGGFVEFSPDGKLLATAADQTIVLVDPETGKEVRRLTGHSRSPQSAAFSPDGKRLASVSWDGTLRLWDVATAEQLEILTERGQHFRDVKFSPDGQTIVTASDDHTVRLWDVRPGVKAIKP
jgi:WD40 repeat protein